MSLSNYFEDYNNKVKYYKKHPIKYIKLFEKDFNIKLKWYQKIKLLLMAYGFVKTNYQRRQEKLDKLLRKYIK